MKYTTSAILKQYTKINDKWYYTNCYFLNEINDNNFCFELLHNEYVVGLIFKTSNMKLVLEGEVIYEK